MINYRMRLNQILGCASMVTRCSELASFLEQCSVEDLKTYYQIIVDSIFGFPCYMGWGIRRIARNTQPKETEAVLRFLAPDGPLFKAVYRLMNDRNFRLEYPVTSLPIVLDQRINRLDIPEYFIKKVHVTYDSYGQATVLRNIFLNPFEYYFFLFTYVNLSIGANQNYLMGWGTLIDTVYTNLLDDYLNYFFPCDGRGVPPISTQARPQSESTFNTDPIIQRNSNITSPSRTVAAQQPTLFRASIFQECMNVPATARDSGFTPSNTYSYLDIWRSETILNAFIEMWITVDCNDTVSSYFRSSLPSVELVKGVRILVRHLHYFSNCLNQQALHPMEELKRTVLPQYQKKLYLFLRHLFNRWPLDNSFRIVYETWLSYIQPWRYNKLENIRHREKEVYGAKETNVDISLWAGFLTDNILFYTVLFQQMLPRFLRADLTSQKNALMLFRATKVFTTQESIKTFLMEIESMIVRYLANPEYHPVGSHQFYHNSGHVIPAGDSGPNTLAEYCSPAKLAYVKQQILELEPANAIYKPLFSEETKHVVKSAITAITQAIETLENTSEAVAPVKQKAGSFLKFWSDGDNSWIGKGDQTPVTDKLRVSQLLGYSKKQLVLLFGLHNADIQSHDFSVADENHSTEGMHLTPGEFSPSILSKLTPRGTFTDDMLTPRGNPDTASLRSHEVAFLVKLFHSISTRLNQKYGQQIISHYYSRDKWGKYARACFARPILYPVIEKVIPGRQVKTVRYLPPRVNLRPLASHLPVSCAIILILASLIFNYSPWLTIFLTAFLYVSFIGLMGCLEKTEAVDNLIESFGPYIHKCEESEYYDH